VAETNSQLVGAFHFLGVEMQSIPDAYMLATLGKILFLCASNGNTQNLHSPVFQLTVIQKWTRPVETWSCSLIEPTEQKPQKALALI
jgi:hypothetical protein